MTFIAEWRDVLWRSATSWVAMILGGILGALAAHWGILFAIIPFLPFWLQLPVAIGLGVLFVGGPIVLARITDQPKLNARIAVKKGASDA